MEGKALLVQNEFAGVDAWPVCLATQDVDEIVRIVECIAPVYGGINLEDISARVASKLSHGCAKRLTSRSSMTINTDSDRRLCSPFERAPRGRKGDE